MGRMMGRIMGRIGQVFAVFFIGSTIEYVAAVVVYGCSAYWFVLVCIGLYFSLLLCDLCDLCDLFDLRDQCGSRPIVRFVMVVLLVVG